MTAATGEGSEPVPRDVQRFVAERVDSVGLLEVLLLLESDRERSWSVPEVCARLRSEPTWAEVQLEYLRVEGLLEAEGGDEPRYRYDPVRPETARVVEWLARAFETRRADVIKLIFSQRPSERLRAFSEAFRLRRDD